MIQEQPDMEAVGDAEPGRTTVELSKELIPDVILMDITMPDLTMKV